MTAATRLGVAGSWPRVTVVFLIAVAVAVTVTNGPGTPRSVRTAEGVGAAAVALTLVGALITYRKVPVAVLLIRWMGSRRRVTGARLGAAPATAVDHRHRYGRSTVGIRGTDGRFVSVIGIAAAPSAGPAGLSMARIAGGLRQLDLRLERIDVVSIVERAEHPGGREHPGGGDPAGGVATWVVLRMDTRRNLAGIVVRESVASTIAAATERFAAHLGGAGLTARILDAGAVAEFDATVLAGLPTEHLRARLNGLEYRTPDDRDMRAASGWLAPVEITSELLGRVLDTDADLSVLTVTLADTESGPRISALVRQHGERAGDSVRAQGNPLTGQQLAAIAATRPIPVTRPALLLPGRLLAAGEELLIPLGAVPGAPTGVRR